MLLNSNLHVFTGGPGSGKTTVLEKLAGMEYPTVSEVGRGIIQRQEAIGGKAVPWSDKGRYAHLMFLHSMADFLEYAEVRKPCFFDRGILDTLGYARLCDLPVPDEWERVAADFRYGGHIFIFPPWEDIYRHDKERKQDFREAQATYEVMLQVYGEHGYTPCLVPFLSPEERVQWIVERIGIVE